MTPYRERREAGHYDPPSPGTEPEPKTTDQTTKPKTTTKTTTTKAKS